MIFRTQNPIYRRLGVDEKQFKRCYCNITVKDFHGCTHHEGDVQYHSANGIPYSYLGEKLPCDKEITL